jgi:hypothetical protein
LVAIAPWVLAYVFWKKSVGKGKDTFDQFVQQNLKPDYRDWFDASGIALDITNQKIALCDKKACKVYGFADIREFRSSFQTGGQVMAFGNVGVNANMQMATANLGTMLKNYSSSGLFIRVRDIDHPEWQMTGIKEKQAKRWMEIFEQHVNEGAVTPAR